MKLKKKIKFSLYLLTFFIGVVLFLISHYKHQHEVPTIGIFLSSGHPNYQECVTHFCSSRNLSSYPTLILNAEGSIKKARKIAKFFHSKGKIKAIFTIGALATKTLSQIETRKPIVFAAIQNASFLSFYKRCSNIYGIEDRLNLDELIFVSKTINEQLNTCVCIYSDKQDFSKKFRNEIKNHCAYSGINFEELAIDSPSLAEKLNALQQNTHVIYIPLEVFDEDLLKYVIDSANDKQIPIITTDPSLITKGICASCYIDYNASGTVASTIMEQVLFPNENKEAKIAEISFSILPQYIIFNEEVVEKLNIKLSKTEKKQIRFLSKNTKK